MKRTVKDHDNFIMEEYEGIYEFFKTCDEREYNPDFNGKEKAREKDNEDWAGASYDEARRLCTYGWDKPVEEVKKKIKNLSKTRETKKVGFKNDVVGFAPNVPNAILGLPESMINQTMVPKRQKVVTLLFDATVPCSVGYETLVKVGSHMCANAIALEKSGYRVKIDILYNFTNWEHSYVLRIPIKSEHNPIDIKRIGFLMSHIAGQRKLSFDWYERLPGAYMMGGYGTPFSHLSDDRFNEVINNVTAGNEIYINYQTDIDDAMSDLF